MRFAITGSSGMVGTHLSSHLQNSGHTVYSLPRELFDYGSTAAVVSAISGVDVVINLAGAPIFKRWTSSYKEQIYHSRIDTTRLLVSAINSSRSVKLLISTSAVGLYPEQGCHDEQSRVVGDSFLAHVCRDWEAAASELTGSARLVIMRLGIVFSPTGGVYEMMSTPTKLGLNVMVGSPGSQITWVDIDDLTSAIDLFTEDESLNGVFNLCSPEPLTSEELRDKVALHHGSLINISLPESLVRLAIGEASTVITQSSCAIPKRLIDAGFKFSSPTIDQFLEKRGI